MIMTPQLLHVVVNLPATRLMDFLLSRQECSAQVSVLGVKPKYVWCIDGRASLAQARHAQALARLHVSCYTEQQNTFMDAHRWPSPSAWACRGRRGRWRGCARAAARRCTSRPRCCATSPSSSPGTCMRCVHARSPVPTTPFCACLDASLSPSRRVLLVTSILLRPLSTIDSFTLITLGHSIIDFSLCICVTVQRELHALLCRHSCLTLCQILCILCCSISFIISPRHTCAHQIADMRPHA